METAMETRISRQWTGVAARAHADAYVAHLMSDTFFQLREIPGFLGARIHRREVDEGTEFLIVTEWQSMEAIHRFAGADAEAAVVPPKAREMLVAFDTRVRHYDLVHVEAMA